MSHDLSKLDDGDRALVEQLIDQLLYDETRHPDVAHEIAWQVQLFTFEWSLHRCEHEDKWSKSEMRAGLRRRLKSPSAEFADRS